MSCTLWPDQCTFIFIVHSSEKEEKKELIQKSERLKQPLKSVGVSAACFCNLWNIVQTQEAGMHLLLFFCGSHSYKAIQLISQRMKRWTQIISFSLFFTARRALFINNNAMIKWHDTQIVVAWRTLSAWINWCNLVLFYECFKSKQVHLLPSMCK